MEFPYAELLCRSNFSFLTAASHPGELVERARELGYSALALTDECSLAGVVRAHEAARRVGLPLLVGSLLGLEEGQRLVALAASHDGYRRLSRLISRARRRAAKGSYRLLAADLGDAALRDCLLIWLSPAEIDDRAMEFGRWLAGQYPGGLWLGLALHRRGDDRKRLRQARQLARQLSLPLTALGDVLMHDRARRPLLDCLTAIRHRCTLSQLGYRAQANSESVLRSKAELARFYPMDLLLETRRLAERCVFSLAQLSYRYPAELVPEGSSASAHLARLTWQGARSRWPAAVPDKVVALVRRELALIRELGYEHYFLTVHDIVRFARQQGILCQGRGSAANSAVCYCLGITEVDPSRSEMLFERFISRERDEPPDIDVDFEHQRREEVIQYIYRKYGRDHAALAAAVISYRGKSALRDLGKVLELPAELIEPLARQHAWRSASPLDAQCLRDAGLADWADDDRVSWLLRLAGELIGFPRHLSQHVGGFVISGEPLDELVPVENAAMPERTVIQWDKDDLETLGLMKVDCLALGMLSAIRNALQLSNAFYRTNWSLADIPAEDPQVYRMIQRADTVGVFQIESRAQMAMLPRLRPACFYDLVVEISIVRPGPIQGDMVHPYLRRRQGREAVEYPSPEVRQVLERTLGVPIFQEQVIRLAMVAAGFSAGEADQLRRSIGAWRRRGGLQRFERPLLDGMAARGYAETFARQIYQQLLGFGEYGFPESHAASFALLVYVSAWLKRHRPAAFFAALLNAQPMGFYAPSQLLQAARRDGVQVRPVDVLHSEWQCTLEPVSEHTPAIRLGMRLVKGLGEESARAIVRARQQVALQSLQHLALRASLSRKALRALAAADALRGLAGNRYQAHWQVAGMEPRRSLFDGVADPYGDLALPEPTAGQQILADYRSTGVSLRGHPLALLRKRLRALRMLTARALRGLRHDQRAFTAGLVLSRQRPSSASRVVFVTLEDETGQTNLLVWADLAERYRRPLLGSRLLAVAGRIQREGQVLHLIAEELADYSALLGDLQVPSRDFR